MARDFDGVDDVITLATEDEFTSSSKISLSAIINPDVVTTFRTILAKRTGGTATFHFRIGRVSGDKQLTWTWTEGGAFQSYGSAGDEIDITAGVTTQIGVGFDWASPGSVDYVIDGVVTTRSRSFGTGTDPDDANVPITIGRRHDDAMEFDGHIAEPARWNRKLIAAEWAVLGARFSPQFVPNDVVYHSHLLGNNNSEPDIVGRNNGAVTGAVKSSHPRIIYPAHVGIITAPAAAGFIPYPNPRYALTGGMQPMAGGT